MTSSIKIIPTAVTQSSVQRLVQKLDDYQISLYGRARCNLEPVERLMETQSLLLGAYDRDMLVGIGAIRFFTTYAEVKRMYVEPAHRNRGIAFDILCELENYACYKGTTQVCLETGRLQLEAIRLYRKAGYHEIIQYGDYSPNNVSLYFRKILSSVP